MKLSVSVYAKRIVAVLLGVALALILASVVTNIIQISSATPYEWNELVRLWNLSTESNIPTWFTSSSLLLAAVLLWLITCAKYQVGDRFRFHWLGLGAILVMMSLSATATIHDWSLEQYLLNNWETQGFLYFPWVILGWVFVGALAVIYATFIFALPTSTRNLFILSAVLYISGALGLEMLSAYLMESYANETIWRGLVATVKQSLELIGIIVFIYGLLSYIAAQYEVIELKFVSK